MNNNITIKNDGFILNICIKGSGSPVLVVGSSIYYPRLFSNELYKNFQFIYMDHRGFVKSPRKLEPEDYTLDKILSDIEKVRTTLNLTTFSILGHSGHAFMALEYAKRYPNNIEKVILLNSAPSNSMQRQKCSHAFFEKDAIEERKQVLSKEMELLQRDIEIEPERRFSYMCIRMGAMSFFDYNFDSAYLWKDVYTNMEIIDYLWGVAFSDIDITNGLEKLNKPILLGLGRFDYLVAPITLWDSIIINNTQVKKVVFEESGHNPMLEEEFQFNGVLTKFLKDENESRY
ncbi:alpha/beta fold hydrolase [Bacillus solimangrovi]|uniref:Alpha/beta hydrolase n=1 Tax=Bacillus solimangrovi TaxID=1305675 RepID=A0A1E5LFB1_9BACI|nr:alpha/beta hydrolase [Bacillus solimangrovi]OEH92778.1 alpha/beta hydrolase [Bacillus solimangrovi]